MPRTIQQRDSMTAEIKRLVSVTVAAGDLDRYSGKRRFVRSAAPIPLEATRDPTGAGSTWAMSMHNISLAGIAAWSHEPLTLGDLFYVRDVSTAEIRPWLSCEVRHCTAGLRGHLIGSRFIVPD